MKLFKKNKYVTLYVLSNVFQVDENNIPLNMKVYTVTSTLQECEEYLDLYLYYKYKNHFENWCLAHNLIVDNEESWLEYKEDVLYEEIRDEYLITKNNYSVNVISSVFRMFNSCCPLGCSFENDVELNYFIQNMNPETLKTIEKELEVIPENNCDSCTLN